MTREKILELANKWGVWLDDDINTSHHAPRLEAFYRAAQAEALEAAAPKCSETREIEHHWDGATPLYEYPPVPSVPEGWLRAIDESLVCSHLGTAESTDSYEEAKKKLNELISWNITVATDPCVNGGYQLVPVEPTEAMLFQITPASAALSEW